MNVTGNKFQSLCEPACKSLAWSNHRTTLPQSRPLGVPAPSEREPGGVRTIHRAGGKPGRCGRFSSPLRNSENFGFYHSSNDTPSVTPCGRASSLREGAGRGGCHSTCRWETGTLAGDFHRPYATQRILVFTIHRTTLPQSRPLGVPAPSEREPGGAGAIQRAGGKPQRCGRFSSPLRRVRAIHWGAC